MRKGTRYVEGYVGENEYGASVAKDSMITRNRPMKSLTTRSKGSTTDYSNEANYPDKMMSQKNGWKYKG